MTPPLTITGDRAPLLGDLTEVLEGLDRTLLHLRDLEPELTGGPLWAVEEFRSAVGVFARAVRGWTDEEGR